MKFAFVISLAISVKLAVTAWKSGDFSAKFICESATVNNPAFTLPDLEKCMLGIILYSFINFVSKINKADCI